MAVIKVDGFDLWQYTRVAPGEGMDIADTDFLQPQFGDTGLGDGDPLLNVKRGNRELSLPIHLQSPTKSKDDLHSRISDLNRRLSAAKILEWRDDGATASTFLKIQFARFEPEFNKRRQDAGWQTGVVRIYTEPYGRSVASGYTWSSGSFAGTGVVASISIASRLSGDAPMTTRFDLVTPTAYSPFSRARSMAGAILPASYVAEWAAASLVITDSKTVLSGASGAAGSQILQSALYNTSAFNTASGFIPRPLAQVVITNASTYAGNNRVLAIANSCADIPISIGRNRPGAITSVQPWHGWQTVDLGVEYIDPRAGATHTITISAEPWQHSHYGFGINNSAVLEINRVILLPEGTSSFLVDTSTRRLIGSLEGKSTMTPTTPIVMDDLGNEVSATSVFQSVGASAFLMYSSNPGQGQIRGSWNPATGTGVVHRAEIVATAADISGSIDGHWSFANAFAAASIASELGIGKHTESGDWAVRVKVANASVCALAVIYSNATVAGSVVASVAFPNVNVFNGTPSSYRTLSLRMKQQGPAITGEAIFYNEQNARGSVMRMATIAASSLELSRAGTPLISLMDFSFERAVFAEVPSVSLLGGDSYSVSGDDQTALRTGGDGRTSSTRGMRSGFVTFEPDASKYTAAVVMHLPMDRSGALDQPWSANVSLNERFTYSK